jgi:tetratricopeptide (TPR) repeat protein
VAQSLLTPALRSTAAFDRQYPHLQSALSDWTMEFMFELHNAGLSEPVYRERRLRYIHEFLARFPDEEDDRYLEFRRGEGEALWDLGQTAAAEAVYAALVEKLPHKGWGYIGWADHYFLMDDSPKDYARAEAILRRALAQPHLEEREDVLERLQAVYKEWGKPERATAVAAELAALRGAPPRQKDHKRNLPLPG